MSRLQREVASLLAGYRLARGRHFPTRIRFRLQHWLQTLSKEDRDRFFSTLAREASVVEYQDIFAKLQPVHGTVSTHLTADDIRFLDDVVEAKRTNRSAYLRAMIKREQTATFRAVVEAAQLAALPEATFGPAAPAPQTGRANPATAR